MTHEPGDSCFASPCSSRAQEVIAQQMQPNGGLFEIGKTAQFWISDEEMDIAFVLFPKNTYKGIPAEYRVYSDAVPAELANASFVTYGYGLTETESDPSVLRSSSIPELRLERDTFTSTDSFRVDHGDSGGPVLATIPGRAKPLLVAVNHAYNGGKPTEQYFKPLRREFFDTLVEQGVNLPRVECKCVENTTFVRREAGRVAQRWSEPKRETYTELKGLSDQPCAETMTPAATETYPSGESESGAAVEVTRASTGMRCTAKAL
jgi:hypothetical protein